MYSAEKQTLLGIDNMLQDFTKILLKDVIYETYEK